MRRSSTVVLASLLFLLIGAGFLAANPELAQSLLEELGLAAPALPGYTASGFLEAEVLHLASDHGGRVKEVPYAPSQTVQAGDVVAVLDAEALEAQRDAAEARYRGARARLEMLEEGPRQVDLAVAQAAVDLARVIWEGALLELEDAAESLPDRLRDERVAVAQAAVDRARAGLRAARSQLSAVRGGASAAELDLARAAVEAAVAELAKLEGQVAAQEIQAPVDGVVLDELLLPGELALPGRPVIALAPLGELELTVYLPQSELGWARVGDPVEVRPDAFPGSIFLGRVTHIADEAEFIPRTVQTPEDRKILVYAVRVGVPNPAGSLKPGLSAEAMFGSAR